MQPRPTRRASANPDVDERAKVEELMRSAKIYAELMTTFAGE